MTLARPDDTRAEGRESVWSAGGAVWPVSEESRPGRMAGTLEWLPDKPTSRRADIERDPGRGRVMCSCVLAPGTAAARPGAVVLRLQGSRMGWFRIEAAKEKQDE